MNKKPVVVNPEVVKGLRESIDLKLVYLFATCIFLG